VCHFFQLDWGETGVTQGTARQKGQHKGVKIAASIQTSLQTGFECFKCKGKSGLKRRVCITAQERLVV